MHRPNSFFGNGNSGGEGLKMKTPVSVSVVEPGVFDL